MPAYPSEVEEAEAEGVEILASWGPEAMVGGDGAVRGVRLVRCTKVFDDGGRFAPRFDRDTSRELGADMVIVAIGQEAEHALRGHAELDFDVRGLLKPAEAGIFASGDLVLGPSSVVEAVASARRAAGAIDRHLGGDGEIPSIVEPEEAEQWLGPDQGFGTRSRVATPTADPVDRIRGFVEVEATWGVEAAAAEAGRCLQCDLRLRISPPIWPPPRFLALTEGAVSTVPEAEGVYQLLGADHVALKIAGTRNLREALADELAGAAAPPYFVYDEDPMYTKRESELIQQFLAAHGRMPSFAGDDLDDLF
jgi:hypothetical protein